MSTQVTATVRRQSLRIRGLAAAQDEDAGAPDVGKKAARKADDAENVNKENIQQVCFTWLCQGAMWG